MNRSSARFTARSRVPTTHFVTAALLLSCVLVTMLACSPPDPKTQLMQARAAHQLQMLTWTEGPSPDDPDASVAVISMRVVERGSPLALECLTIDVVFEDDGGQQVNRTKKEVLLSDIADQGGSIETVVRAELPQGVDVAGVGVDLHPAGEDELMSLCEAKAIAEGS